MKKRKISENNSLPVDDNDGKTGPIMTSTPKVLASKRKAHVLQNIVASDSEKGGGEKGAKENESSPDPNQTKELEGNFQGKGDSAAVSQDKDSNQKSVGQLAPDQNSGSQDPSSKEGETGEGSAQANRDRSAHFASLLGLRGRDAVVVLERTEEAPRGRRTRPRSCTEKKKTTDPMDKDSKYYLSPSELAMLKQDFDELEKIGKTEVSSQTKGKNTKKGKGKAKGQGKGKSLYDFDSSEDADVSANGKKRRKPTWKVTFVPEEKKTAKSGGKKAKATKRQTKKKGYVECVRCQQEFEDVSKLKYHMVSVHQAVWSPKCPEGSTDAASLKIVIKTMKKIFCPKCKKELHNYNYYKFHTDWCGREDEMEVCEICQKPQKLMWMATHMRHHAKDKKEMDQAKARLEELSKKAVDNGNGEVELTKTGVRKRMAAKRALTSLNELDLIQDEETGAKRKKTSAGGDDAEAGDEQDEEIDALLKVLKSSKKMRGARLSSAKSRGIINDSPDAFMDVLKFCETKKPCKLFPKLRPQKEEWKPISNNEKKMYIPEAKQSPYFSVVTNGTDESEMMQLEWTESYCYEDQATIFVGGPVWVAEWCPVPHDSTANQIAIVACNQSMEGKHMTHKSFSGLGLLQIWDFGQLQVKAGSVPEPTLALTIAHNYGCVYCACWCPQGAWDDPSVELKTKEQYSRLGLVAVGCSDGTVRIYSIPHPESIRKDMAGKELGGTKKTLVWRPDPSLSLQTRHSADLGCCQSLAWQPSNGCRYILGGYSKGTVQIWDLTTVSPLLLVSSSHGSEILPFRTFQAHYRSVTSCAWSPSVPSCFATSSTDKYIKFWNINNTTKPYDMSDNGSILKLSWAGPLYCGVILAPDDIAGVPCCSFQESGINGQEQFMRRPLDIHDSCVWDLSFSPWMNFLFTCDGGGCVVGVKTMTMSVQAEHLKNFIDRRTAVYQVDLKKISDGGSYEPEVPEEEQAVNSELLYGDQERSMMLENYPQTYDETVEKYFLQFKDRNVSGLVLKPDILTRSQNNMPCAPLGRFPILSLYKVAVNPNLQSCTWLLSGGQAGFLRLHNIAGMMTPSARKHFKS